MAERVIIDVSAMAEAANTTPEQILEWWMLAKPFGTVQQLVATLKKNQEPNVTSDGRILVLHRVEETDEDLCAFLASHFVKRE